jgi:23S rRNA pseudouridine2605 synthase
MRLQVFLSQSGVCSRRKALQFVQEGFVSVNAQTICEPSFDVTAGKDIVLFRGVEVAPPQSHMYLMLYKPCGYVTTLKDRHAEHTVMELLSKEYQHVYPVGRLDKDSQGLLLFTNDGQLANRLMHPSFKVDKSYEVEVRGMLTDEEIEKLKKGVYIEHERTLPAQIFQVQKSQNATRFRITIHQGMKRQIRLMLASVRHPVIKLKRVTYGPLTLGKLKSGTFRLLTHDEVSALRSGCSLPG